MKSQPSPPNVVLIVDDSAVVRHTLKGLIEADPAFRCLAASDPYEAVAVMRRTVPTAIVLDVDMPRMDGLTFLKKIMSQHPLPVILCTDYPERGVTALEWGALEVIPKPSWEKGTELDAWAAGLRESLRLAVGRNGSLDDPTSSSVSERYGPDVILPRQPYVPSGALQDRIIALGASTGGVQAIHRVLTGLPPNMPGIVVVQHMPAGFTGAFADRLNRDPNIALHVIEAHSGDPIRPGVVLIVPGTAHGVVRRAGRGYRLDLKEGPPVSRHRPSVDVLFRSVAQAAGPRGAGAILTGMLDDGALGLREMFEAGAWTIAQDQATCTVFGMPREAIRRGAARQVLPLDRIGPSLVTWTGSE